MTENKSISEAQKKCIVNRTPQVKAWQSAELSKGYIADYKPFNFVDGEGVRCSLYVSGCLFACEECFNKAAQSFAYGTPFTEELLNRVMEDLSNDYVQGLTLLGGEPFLNTEVCLQVVKKLRAQFGNNKDIWAWSGYTFEQLLLEADDKLNLLNEIDILVDGPFKIKEKNLNLQFRGSNNQRIIDVQKSLETGKTVLWTKCKDAKLCYEQIHKDELI